MTETRLKDAALALQTALAALEQSLDPLLSRLARSEQKAQEADAFGEDRARLAQQLDDALEAKRVRDAEFKTLSEQTREELDLTIATLKDVLGGQENG